LYNAPNKKRSVAEQQDGLLKAFGHFIGLHEAEKVFSQRLKIEHFGKM